jgi:hypothetical protein
MPPLFEMTEHELVERPATTFADLGLGERSDLQRLLRDNIQVLGEDLRVVSEEFGDWEDAKRRIDLLALDRTGHLVVVELKRDSGTHMELQAIRYAAMVSAMTFEQVADAYAKYLTARGNPKNLEAVSDLLEFFDHSDEADPSLSTDVRILLVAADFNREITTTVLWLNRFEGMDIRCVRLLPHHLDGKTYLDIDQVIPLRAAADYQVQVRRKEAERERVTRSGADWTQYQVIVNGQVSEPLRKRQAVLRVIQEVQHRGGTMAEITEGFPKRKVRIFDQVLTSAEEVETALEGAGVTEVGRWFSSAFIVEDGRTWVVQKMWGLDAVPTMRAITERFPQTGVSFQAVVDSQ